MNISIVNFNISKGLVGWEESGEIKLGSQMRKVIYLKSNVRW